jgi:hypothetical protein
LDELPGSNDVFCTKFFGRAPAQNAYTCRLRLPNGIVSSTI